MVFACFRTSAWLAVTSTLLWASPCAHAADTVDSVQRAAAEWTKLRTETVRLQTEWQWQRDSLDATLAALRARVTALQHDRDTLRAEIDAETAKSSELIARTDAARRGMDTVAERLQQLTTQMVAVRPFLPPRLSEGLELAFRSIEDPKLSATERMQHVITIFNRSGAFNKSITFAEQELALDGSANPRLLEVLYFGLSHAYAYDRTNNAAYLGQPGDAGWAWEPKADFADDIERLIAIYHEQTDPAYIVVPARIAEPFPAANNR